MKKTLLLLTGLSLFASQASATLPTTLFTFDDVPGGSIPGAWIPMPTYKEFDFNGFGVKDLTNNETVSGDFVLYLTNGDIGGIQEENGADFTFDGLQVKTWDNGSENYAGTLVGKKNNENVWMVDMSLNSNYKYYGAQAGSIDLLYIYSDTGLFIDDLSLTTVSPVPEPSSIALMLGGLGLVGFMAARRAKKA